MNEQLPLFEWRAAGWVENVWSRLGPQKRREILLILAEMGRASLNQKKTAMTTKERPHER
ncbi:MAG: hypothetical protein MUQ00_10100 [Candidatus Aminicenantes bacterium]|nr:hypothetical protein [Candidatus Aminicenantes bacterium]